MPQGALHNMNFYIYTFTNKKHLSYHTYKTSYKQSYIFINFKNTL